MLHLRHSWYQPIVHRGLRERSAETKKKAAQIVGNMCYLVTEPKDMIPYIGLLLPEVKNVLGCKSHWLSYKGNGRRKLLRLGSLVVRYSEITVMLSAQEQHTRFLLDPIPEVRSVAARAIGSLVRGMGEENLLRLGLADENESVRDAAYGAGHVLVEYFATTSLPLLLPAVEEGIFSDNWHIRQSSGELLGDLLFKVAGTSEKAHLEGGSDDEGF
nr:eIF-2-alpha kinase activator GCN1 isoform X22 [Ipomoea batatas]